MSDILSQALGGLAAGAQSLPGLLTQILGAAQGAAGGGLPALLAQLENVGLGEQVRSWIGHGENLPVTPEQLAPVFSREQLEAWAKAAGTTPEALLKVLAEALPQVVHQATPEGKLPPEGTALAELSHLVHRVLGR
jgi:uncharacterized protein YidB (DUF937 family)